MWLAQGLVGVLYPHHSRTPSSQEAKVNLIHEALGLLSVSHIVLMIPMTMHPRGGLQQIGPIERESMPFAGHATGGGQIAIPEKAEAGSMDCSATSGASGQGETARPSLKGRVGHDACGEFKELEA